MNKLVDYEGICSIIDELNEIIEVLNDADKSIEPITNAIMRKHGISIKQIENEMIKIKNQSSDK